MARAARQAWMKFYTRDWRSSPKLRMCSYAARGLWIDMLTIMAESPAYGFLLVNEVVPSARQLAGLLGGTEKEIAGLLAELGEADVYSVTGQDDLIPEEVRALIPQGMPAGIIFSRRMLRDRAKAEKDAANGKGGGNPKLRQWVNPPVIPRLPKMHEAVNRQEQQCGIEVKAGVNPLSNPQSQNQNPESISSRISTDAARDAALPVAGYAPRAQRQTVAQRVAEIAARKRLLT